MVKILYLGQKPIGEKCFKFLAEKHNYKKIQIVGVVSNSSVSNWWSSNNIYQYCKYKDIRFIDNEKRSNREILKLIDQTKPDFLLSVQHPWILPKKILNAVKGNALNLHLAPLPGYKGYNCANHSILNKEKNFGVSLHWMSEEVDEGKIAGFKKIKILSIDTAFSLYKKSESEGENLFKKIIKLIVDRKQLPKNNMKGDSKFFSKDSLSKFRKINDINNLTELETKARAFFFPPNEPAYFVVKKRRYYVYPQASND